VLYRDLQKALYSQTIENSLQRHTIENYEDAIHNFFAIKQDVLLKTRFTKAL